MFFITKFVKLSDISMLDAIPAHTSLVHHYFYFSQHFTAERSDPVLWSLASCFSLGAQLILLLLFLVFVKRWNPDTAETEAGPNRNVKITSSGCENIYSIFAE